MFDRRGNRWSLRLDFSLIARTPARSAELTPCHPLAALHVNRTDDATDRSLEHIALKAVQHESLNCGDLIEAAR